MYKMKLSDFCYINPTEQLKRHEEYEFIEMADLTPGNRYVFSKQKKIFNGSFSKFSNKDTLMAKITPCLENGKISQYIGENKAFGSTEFNIFREKENISNADYLYYLVSSTLVKEPAIKSMSGATGRQRANLDEIKQIDVPDFSISTQEKIAKILSNYDNLIENNNKRIKILEEMAQKIYKEWFVDFKFPGHETTTFKDSPLGKIPNNWEVKPMEKLLIHQIGGGWGNEIKTDKYNTPAYVIRGTDIPNGRQGCIENCPLRYHTSSNLKTRTLNENDIVFEVSGGSKGQPVGRTLILNKNLFNQFKNNVICASFCKLLRVDQTQIIPEYIYLHLLNIYNNGEIEKYQTQSTGIINFKFNFFLENEKILIPEQNIISKFEKIIKPIFDEIFLLGNKNQVLKQTRDTLLPRLISGEINVENMEVQ